MLRTRITEQYGLKVPFINAGMAFIATAPLVRSVCEAGGMGMQYSAAMKEVGNADRQEVGGSRWPPLGRIGGVARPCGVDRHLKRGRVPTSRRTAVTLTTPSSGLSRMPIADLVQTNGFGSAL
jgi:hypothetical protein